MRLGKIKIIIIVFFFFNINLYAEDRILSAPIINLENLEPSYENLENELDNESKDNIKLKKREQNIKENKNFKYVNLIGLDKITAKTKPIKLKIGETIKFGLLEIKALKCGVSVSKGIEKNLVAYLQVKYISENQNEKVFIFNGWTFSSSPSITPIDHAVYDIWLVDCQTI